MEMGFDYQKCLEALNKFGGDENQAISFLL
jgi:hypothetical protein